MIIKTVMVSDKGQVSIPVEIRNKAGIKRGDELIIMQDDSKILIEKAYNLSKSMRDGFKDLLANSEKTAKKLWSNKQDEIWDKV